MIPVIDHKFLLKDRSSLVRLHLFIKCYELGDYPESSALDVLEHLYYSKGISNKEENNAFIESCVNNKLRGSAQSVRNVLSKYTDLGILKKPKNCIRLFKDPIIDLPEVFALTYFTTNLQDAKKH